MMEVGTILEWAALIVGLAALALLGAHLRWGDERMRRFGRYGLVGSVVFANAALLLLVLYFLFGRIDIEYVFLYTRTDYAWYYKLVGTWGAQKGTILMWGALTGLAALWLLRDKSRDAAGRRVQDWMLFFATVLYVAFLLLIIGQHTFAPTSEALLRSRPLGNGLNPVLLSPWILIHPPAEFIGYALVAIPAAGALAYLATGERAWAVRIRTESRMGWIAYTLGIVLGAMWAYNTLNFGGYWAWDPVEVANLVPWLFLTAFMHARVHHEKFGTYRVLAPVLAIAAFVFTLFQTIATRSGLWVSVHAFTDPTGTFAKDPFLRLVNILNADPQVAAIFGVMVAVTMLSLVFASLRGRAVRPRSAACAATAFAALGGAVLLAPATFLQVTFEGSALLGFGNTTAGLLVIMALLAVLAVAPSIRRMQGDDGTDTGLLSFRGQVQWATLLLLTGTLVTLVLLLRGVNGLNRQVFDDWAPIIALPLILLMVPAFGHGFLSRRVQVGLMVAPLVLGIVAAVVWDPWALALTLPALAVAGLVGLARISDLAIARSAPPLRRSAVMALLVGGLAALVQWSNPPSMLLNGFMAIPSPAWLQPFGLVASLACLTVLPLLGHAGHRRLTLIVAGAEVLLWGHGIAALAGIVAVGATLADRTGQEGPSLRDTLARRLPGMRAIAVQFIHLAVVFGLAGYAFSTYGATEPDDAFFAPEGGIAELGTVDLRIMETDLGYDAEAGFVTTVTTYVQAEKEGRVLGTGAVAFHWVEQVQHYDPETRILRMPGQDIYIASLAFCTDPGGACRSDEDWVEAHENGVAKLVGDETVSAVAFEAKALPMMGILWSSLYLFVLGIVLLQVSRIPMRRPAPRPAPVETDLGARIEEELRRAVAADHAP